MPYGTRRIRGMNCGQQVLQQRCPVPPRTLTDSSSRAAVLSSTRRQMISKSLLKNTLSSVLSSRNNFWVPRPYGKNNQWATNAVESAWGKGEGRMPETRLPRESHCSRFGNEPQRPRIYGSPLAWERRHTRSEDDHLLSETPQDGDAPYVSAGCHHGEGRAVWGKPTRQDHAG